MATETRILEELGETKDLLDDIGGVPPRWPRGEEDDRSPFRDSERGYPSRNAKLGMAMFLGVETMFFAGLIAAFLYLRLNASEWPPASQPRLPVFVTGINTLLLLASGFTMWRVQGPAARQDSGRPARGLGMTFLLGTVFLVVQGYEWARLVRFGLTFSSGSYGATFYTLIGLHGLHVLGALTWLAALQLAAKKKRLAPHHPRVFLCAMYWYFVVALWPVLYGLVYLV